MAEYKKVLDQSGVQYLWSKISMEDYPNNETLIAVINAIDETKANKDEIPMKVSELENDSKFVPENEIKNLFKNLSSDRALRFYCIEDVEIVVNDVSTIYPANSNVEIKLLETDTWEIIPTSDNSIQSLTGFPGALGTYYSWLEGVKQFSNILFDMNDVEFYSKWSQGNQGAYQVQYAQYLNCIFWSDNAYVSDVSKRTNYTLYNTAQLPLCYSSIPDNTFKAFYLAFNVNSDPNWGNKAYRESFAKATWATQAFSYYGARTIGIFGHDDPDFNITLPKDCRGLMYQSTAIENAGTFDAINTTNFGAKSGSWRDAFGQCSSLRNLFIKNLTVNLNISWSPINYESIYFIVSKAANTNAITISVSPYTYNLLGPSDFELAASKNITIELITTNYVEDRRLSTIADKADKNYVDEKIADLVDSAPETMNTIGALATALQENKEVVDILNAAITNKADKTYVDELIANIPTEADIFIVSCPDGSVISHTFEQIMAAVNANKAVYASIYGTTLAPLTHVADDGSYVEFNTVGCNVTADQFVDAWIDGLVIKNDNSFSVKYADLLPRRHSDINGPEGEKDIINVINYLVEKANTEQSPSVTPTPDPIITEYVYTYDGDTDSENNTWITNYGGTKVFAKMGEIPKGTLNLVGSTVFRTNPSNQWLDRTFTITQEHLDKVLNKASTDIPATQEGLIQIYDMMGSDFSEFTVLCICTLPGWYNICFDDWYEIINFPETGIYAYDKRTYGGNDYTKTFTFTTTTYPSTGGGASNSDEINNPVHYNGTEFSMFSRGICIGDSVTEGSFDNPDGGAVVPRFSYPAILKRLTGVDVVNAGIAGMTSQTWYEASLNSDPHWGKWFNNEWVWNMNPTNTGNDTISSALDYSGYEFAIIHMGINDLAPLYDGSKTINEVLLNFETYMNNIITKLKTANSGIRLFLATIIPSYAPQLNSDYQALNDKIKEMVENTEHAYLLDLNKYSESASKSAYNRTHPTALGYHKLASEIAAYISYIIKTNLDGFEDVQFIGM